MVTLLGWIGALLALVAYAQTSAIRLRQVALASSVALLAFAAMLGIWSNVVLELTLGAVNMRRLLQLRHVTRAASASTSCVNMNGWTHDRSNPQPSPSQRVDRRVRASR
jgi:hypothetical protein